MFERKKHISNNIKSILKPKSYEEIIKILCEKYNIPYDIKELDFLYKIHNLIPFINIENEEIPFSYLTYENKGKVSYLNKYDVNKYDVIYNTKIIKPNKNFSNFKKIYETILDNIISNIKYPCKKNSNIIKQIMLAQNIISINSRGIATFLIGNKNFLNKNKKELLSLNLFLIEENDKIKNKVLIGRKQNELEEGIYLFKNKNKYSIDCIGNVKNNYISINI